MVTGFAQCASNPAVSAASKSPAWPYPVNAISRIPGSHRAQPHRQLVSIHPGKPNVEHANLGTEAAARSMASWPFAGDPHDVTRAFERARNICRHPRCRRREEFAASPSRRAGQPVRVRRSSPVACWRGNVTTNRLPPSASRGSTRIVPPCSSVNVRASARPSPSPPSRRSRVARTLRERIEQSSARGPRECPDRCLHRR